VTDPNWQFPAANCDTAVLNAAGAGNVGTLDADALAVQLVGDSLLLSQPADAGLCVAEGPVR